MALQKERKDKLGRILIDLGYIAERDVTDVLSEQLNVPLFHGEYPAVPIEPAKLSYRFLRAFHIVPLHIEANVLSVVMADPLDAETRSALKLRTGFALNISLGAESEFSNNSRNSMAATTAAAKSRLRLSAMPSEAIATILNTFATLRRKFPSFVW